MKEHPDEGMVRDGGIREHDRVGNNAADEAADFGRRKGDSPVIDARRNFAGVLWSVALGSSDTASLFFFCNLLGRC